MLKMYRLVVLMLFMGGIIPDRVCAFDLTSRPNIILIIVDHLKPALGCYGDTLAQTPNIDRLAQSSFVFENNHTQQAAVSSTRASLMTGKRPDYTMVWNVNTPIRKMISDILTMPQYFRKHGYETAAIGKIYDPRSVDAWHDSLSWSVPYRNIAGNISIAEDWNRVNAGSLIRGQEVSDIETQDGRIARESIQQLGRFALQDRPFFLLVGFHKPNLPFVAPRKYWELFSREDMVIPSFQKAATGTPGWVYQIPGVSSDSSTCLPDEISCNAPVQKELIHGYYACVSFIDHQIGSIVSHLEAQGVLKNTILVVCGDQGMHLGDHRIWFGHTNLENATRTPLIISHGSRYRGKTVAPTELLDIFPTLCELARVQPPESLDGKSLIPLMTGNEKSVKLYSVSQNERLGDSMGYAFRNERYRYVVWVNNNFRSYMSFSRDLVVARELYDYVTDPMETVNLIDHTAYEDVVRKFEYWSANFFIDQEKSQSKGNHFFND